VDDSCEGGLLLLIVGPWLLFREVRTLDMERNSHATFEA
ncbi:unnamed protein product, partial [Acidithrix sp. C25]